MNIVVKLLLSRRGRKLAAKALKSRRIRKVLRNKHAWSFFRRQLERRISRSR